VPFKNKVSDNGLKLASRPLIKTDADVLSEAELLTIVSVVAEVG